MTFFDVIFSVRLRLEELKAIDKVVSNPKYDFDSRGHFVRASVIQKLREYKKR